jgi:F420-0:gamma-glutamyl ligase
MDFLPIKTRKFIPPQDKGKLFALLDEFLPRLKEKDIIAVTSKIIAIHQGRFVRAKSMAQKLQLIKREADGVIPGQIHGLTLKDTALIPYAGIDRTNSRGHYIFWPKNPHQEAGKIWQYLKSRHRLNELGIIIIDSFCLPRRRGHLGISLGWWGFYPNRSFSGRQDIFGRKIVAANSNYVDALAAMAGVLMGETDEQTPLLVIRGFAKLKFTIKNTLAKFQINSKDDMYAPLLKQFK